MDTRTGRIYTPEEMEKINKHLENQNEEFYKDFQAIFKRISKEEHPKKKSDLKLMKIPPTEKQLKRKKIGRNNPCPCDSGKKFKKCCLQNKD